MKASVAVALVALTTMSPALGAQLRPTTDSEPVGWIQPAVRLGNQRRQPIVARPQTTISPQVGPDGSQVPSVMGAMLIASLGSAVGGVTGLYVGLAAHDGEGDYLARALVGGLVGSVTGAALGAGAVTHRGGRAFLGSVAGSLLALAIIHDNGSDSAALTYVLVHGSITGLIAGITVK